jgi:hypothetical protein
LEEPGGRSVQTANEHLCTVRRHNQPHPRLGHKTGIPFAARPRTCACFRRCSGSIATEGTLRPAVCGWTNPRGPVAPSSVSCANGDGAAASSMAGSVDTSAPRSLPVFSTSFITFNTPSNLSVKGVRTEYERWVFAIGQLHPVRTLAKRHPQADRRIDSSRMSRTCGFQQAENMFDGSLKNVT